VIIDHEAIAPTAELGRLAPPARGPLGPGLLVAAGCAVLAFALSRALPALSPLVVAMVLGVIIANAGFVNDGIRPGLVFCAKRLLRVGIVLLGFRLVVTEVLHLGPAALAVVALTVAATFFGTQWLGRRLGCSRSLSLLVATGFSICGASAIAAVEPFADAEEEDIALSIALVTLCGTLAIFVLPLAGSHIGLQAEAFGFWAGASVHDVAQVVATASTETGAMQTAAIVKLTRVAMLAPLVAAVSVAHRRRTPKGGERVIARRPPMLPMFVIGFLAAVAVRSSGVLPDGYFPAIKLAEQAILAAALVGLGTGVRVHRLRVVGWRPLALGLSSWLLVAGVAYGGSKLVG